MDRKSVTKGYKYSAIKTTRVPKPEMMWFPAMLHLSLRSVSNLIRNFEMSLVILHCPALICKAMANSIIPPIHSSTFPMK